MKIFSWQEAKNQKLMEERSISFIDIVEAINNQQVLDKIIHPNQLKYPGQVIFFVELDNYVWAVPAIETRKMIFLKTAYKSRRATKIYLGGDND